jgi:metallo-beta-lactamase family protein
MTKATRQLMSLSLYDAAKVAAEDKKGKILYTDEDIERLLRQVEEVNYDETFQVGEFTLTFRNAGHILGSASIEISDTSKKTIVFSGDLGNTPEDMIAPTEQVKTAAYVVMESTYGDRIHHEEDPSEVLREEISEVEKTKGVLLIPAFSIERAQEILHRIGHLKKSGAIGENTSVFLDSPMSIKALEIFKENASFFNKEMQRDMQNASDPFDFPGLSLTTNVEESKAILFTPGPKVIISGSGMMSGGRVLHHAVNYLPDPATRLLIVGYQANGTLGRQLLDGAKQVKIYNEEVTVKAKLREVESMSCHADQPKLLHWLSQITGVKKVFLTHGEDSAREVLQKKILREEPQLKVVLPGIEEIIDLAAS